MQKRQGRWRSICHGFLAAVLILMLIPTLPIQTQAAEVPSIQAAGVLVMDAQTGEIYYERNIDVARPAASMSKLMSIYLIFDEMAAGRLTWDTMVPASQRAANMSLLFRLGKTAGRTYLYGRYAYQAGYDQIMQRVYAGFGGSGGRKRRGFCATDEREGGSVGD